MNSRQACVPMCAILGVWTMSCMTPASEDEVTSMCTNLVKLRGQVAEPNAETIVSDISMKYEQEAKSLNEDLARARRVLEDEMQTKLEEAKKDPGKEKIKAAYAAKLEALQTDHKPELAKVDAMKKEAIANAKKAAESNRAEWDNAVNECVEQARKEGVSQEIAQCRIKASSTDKYWNGCR